MMKGQEAVRVPMNFPAAAAANETEIQPSAVSTADSAVPVESVEREDDPEIPALEADSPMSTISDRKTFRSSTGKDSPVVSPKQLLSDQTSTSEEKQRILYQRILCRKQAISSEAALQKASRVSRGFQFIGLFSKESVEERHIRLKLRGYKSFLNSELQQLKRATSMHRRRVLDQAAEFEEHEVKLSVWGLKFIIPFYRMQAWSRLSRSSLLRDLSDGLEQIVSERLQKATIYLQHFDESVNRTQKYSLTASEEFCQTPESLLQRDMALINMARRLHSLDEICSSTTRKFLQFEPEYSWNDQARRRRILMRILKRYKAIPSGDVVRNIEQQLSWSDFCGWLANRTKMVSALEAEFSDFVEDQREKEGRLFYRWHQSLYRGTVPVAGSAGTSDSRQQFTNNSDDIPTTAATATTGSGGANNTPSSTAANGLNTPNSAPATHEASSESRNRWSQPRSAANNSNELQDPLLTGDGIVALKATPWSIRNFIRYFANDIIGIQYNIPRDYEDANLALTESLFFRRIHSHVYRYANAEQREADELWRLKCQLCRYLNPTEYHVPLDYLGADASRAAGIDATTAVTAREEATAVGLASSSATAVAAATTPAETGAAVIGSSSPSSEDKGPALSLQRDLDAESVITSTTDAANDSSSSYDSTRKGFLDAGQLVDNNSNSSNNNNSSSNVNNLSSSLENDLLMLRLDQSPAFKDCYKNVFSSTAAVSTTGTSVASSIAATVATINTVTPIANDSSNTSDRKVTEGAIATADNMNNNSGSSNSNNNSNNNNNRNSTSSNVLLRKSSFSIGSAGSHSTTACSCSTCSQFAASKRLQRLPRYHPGQYGQSYARASRVLSLLTTASSTREMIMILVMAGKWLLRDAIDASGSRKTIGADLLVPLFTMMLINAQIPNVHLLLQVLQDYADYEEQGDISYTIANLEGSIQFILNMEIPESVRREFEQSAHGVSIIGSLRWMRNEFNLRQSSVDSRSWDECNASAADAFSTAAVAIGSGSKGFAVSNAAASVISGVRASITKLGIEGLTPLVGDSRRLTDTADALNASGGIYGSGGNHGTPPAVRCSNGSSNGAEEAVSGCGINIGGLGKSTNHRNHYYHCPYHHRGSGSSGSGILVRTRTAEDEEEDNLAMKQLGEWLRDQNTMEDTILILQKEGWMP